MRFKMDATVSVTLLARASKLFVPGISSTLNRSVQVVEVLDVSYFMPI